MLSAATVIVAGLVWLGVLFAVALYGERHPGVLNRRWAIIYALSLAIHCTSWTFYGTVTQANRSGWWLPPTFVGAIGLYVLGAGLMVRLVNLAREHNASSLADLIAARLGRHSGLAALATAVMLLAIIPYIALQLKAVAMSYGIVVHGQVPGTPAWQDSALYVALAMALFAMMFGTRRASTVVHNRGLVLAVAFESLFKLVAMLALGAMLLLPWHGLPAAPVQAPPPDTSGFPSLILLGALAMFAMPHQFHIGVTECRDADHVRTGRWLFPVYLLLIALPILPLARLGDAVLGPSGVSSDLYVLALPLAEGHHGLALLAFLGGLSAATSMVVVATLALSLMVANHFIAPVRVRAGWGRSESRDLRGALLMQRRAAILVIVLLSWAYSRALAGNDALADIGAISFSALAGLLIPTLAAVWRPQMSARAVGAGLLAGTVVWLYVLSPALFAPQPAWVVAGPFGLQWLAPDHLLGLHHWSRLARAVGLNLSVNAVVLLLVAQTRWGRARTGRPLGGVETHELRALATRFLSPEQVDGLFAGALGRTADKGLLAAVEHELAAVIGASSAHLLLDVMRERRHEDLDQVAAIVGEASQDLRFNQRVLEAALENMSQGICVVNGELRVVAWNRTYAEMFDYPPGLLRIGCPVAELMWHNIGAGLIGPADPKRAAERRLAHMRRGTPHHSERSLHDGSVIEIRGNPMPGGGYVATFTDVTRFRLTEAELTRSNETLEQRVSERTRELALASEAAQRANEAKSHFLAAVSHDLLQPLHAAQLFSQALREQLDGSGGAAATASHLGDSLGVTEGLLASLLDIARLEGDQLECRPRDFALTEVMDPLAAEFSALASERGVPLRVVSTGVWVHSDPQLLRRILQNFLGNALRHAHSGEVLLGCRRDGADIRIEVRDTGPGISKAEQTLIFEQFRRGSQASGQGLGLGLAIAERMAGLLGHRLELRSWPGRGSVFSVRVPRASRPLQPRTRCERTEVAEQGAGRALLIDNEPEALRALETLMQSWHWSVAAVSGPEGLSAVPWQPDVLLLDYHLDHGVTGLDVLARLRDEYGELPTAILTADRDAELRQCLLRADVAVLYKPVRPLALRQWLRRVDAARSP